MEEVHYRPATREDLGAMAEVYVAAFPHSIRHFFARRPAPLAAIADVLEVVLIAEPQAALVASVGADVVGYCLAPAHCSRLGRVALRRGLARRLLGRWLTGAYSLGFTPLWRLALDKLRGYRERRGDPHHTEAHILSLAVHPGFQGRGLGRALLQRGLQYLDGRGVTRVRLEVRPDNAPARRLYEQHGFTAVGESADSQGRWVIMLRSAASAAGVAGGQHAEEGPE